MDSLSSHTDYGSVSLDEASVDPDPLAEFASWLTAAERAGIYEPNAMVVGTIDPDGRPSSRTVLLKGLDATGFEFVTNYGSRKGIALLANPAVTLLFPWYSMQRQVIVTGEARPAGPEASDGYFDGRPRGSRIAALASEQSSPIESRAALEARVNELEARFGESGDIPRPENWGAFRVTPQRIEFWQGRTSRLHDRLEFARVDGSWRMRRLQP
jgi:pyridoxamine 5'-phosphate oxidase